MPERTLMICWKIFLCSLFPVFLKLPIDLWVGDGVDERDLAADDLVPYYSWPSHFVNHPAVGSFCDVGKDRT